MNRIMQAHRAYTRQDAKAVAVVKFAWSTR